MWENRRTRRDSPFIGGRTGKHRHAVAAAGCGRADAFDWAGACVGGGVGPNGYAVVAAGCGRTVGLDGALPFIGGRTGKHRHPIAAAGCGGTVGFDGTRFVWGRVGGWHRDAVVAIAAGREVAGGVCGHGLLSGVHRDPVSCVANLGKGLVRRQAVGGGVVGGQGHSHGCILERMEVTVGWVFCGRCVAVGHHSPVSKTGWLEVAGRLPDGCGPPGSGQRMPGEFNRGGAARRLFAARFGFFLLFENVVHSSVYVGCDRALWRRLRGAGCWRLGGATRLLDAGRWLRRRLVDVVRRAGRVARWLGWVGSAGLYGGKGLLVPCCIGRSADSTPRSAPSRFSATDGDWD